MGALHAGHLALVAARPRRVRDRRRVDLRQPAAVRPGRGFRALSARVRRRHRRAARGRRRRGLRARRRRRCTRRASRPRVDPGPGRRALRGRAAARPLPRRRDGVREAVRDASAPTARTSAPRTRSRSRCCGASSPISTCRVELVVVPTVREPDGLALSSRNVYLDAEQRAAAPGAPPRARRDRRAPCARGETDRERDRRARPRASWPRRCAKRISTSSTRRRSSRRERRSARPRSRSAARGSARRA